MFSFNFLENKKVERSPLILMGLKNNKKLLTDRFN